MTLICYVICIGGGDSFSKETLASVRSYCKQRVYVCTNIQERKSYIGYQIVIVVRLL